MKKNKMIRIYFTVLFFAVFVAVIMPVVCIYFFISNNIIRLGLDVFTLIVIAYCIVRLLGEWISQQLNMRCEFTEYLDMLQKMTKTIIYKNNVKIHMTLLRIYLLMGMYEEAFVKFNDFEKSHFRLSDMQKMSLHILYVNYLRETQSSLFQEELDKGFTLLDNLNKINCKDKKCFQKKLLLQKYLKDEQWKNIIKMQQDTIAQSTLEQVEKSYLLGLCYFNLGADEEAGNELKFVVEYGGDTQYVSLAKRMVEKIPVTVKSEKKLIKNSDKKKCVIKYAFILIVCIGLFIFINFFKPRGNSISEVYCKEYYIAENDIQILYEQNLENYELVILCDGRNIAYGIYEKENTNTGNCYSLYYSYRMPIKNMMLNYSKYITEIDEWTDSKSIKQKFFVQQEIWDLIENFYKKIYKKGIFDETINYCVGISFNEYVQEIEISDQAVDIEEIIEVNENQAYIWHISEINLKTIDFFDIDTSFHTFSNIFKS